MKKINVKVTDFLGVIILAVVVLLLNLVEFRRTVDLTVPGIRMPKENAFEKQEEMVEGVGYFQFVYADGETRSFRYASEEQGLWTGEAVQK